MIPVARDWWHIRVDHADHCMLEDDMPTAPQTPEGKEYLAEQWNRRGGAEASAEPIYQTEERHGVWLDDTKEQYEYWKGKIPVRIVYAAPRPSSIEEQIMEANNEFHRPLPRHADYATLHLTPEQAAKEAK
jgi:hypothetical protein